MIDGRPNGPDGSRRGWLPDPRTVVQILVTWIDRNIFALGREVQLSYLPPLMVYMAAGISGLTAIVGVFFVKEYLGLSAAFLAGLTFWGGVPWILKMPLGHVVDLIWRFKGWLVFAGAALIAVSLLIMYGLIGHTDAMRAVMPVEAWYVLSFLLAPVGYVMQDVVADAMTVDAVPRVDHDGQPFDDQSLKMMHTTMQTLGRVAIIGGGSLVALLNIYMFSGMADQPHEVLAGIYTDIYLIALVIPIVSVTGVVMGVIVMRRRARQLTNAGFSAVQIASLVYQQEEPTKPNWPILGGSLVFSVCMIAIGLGRVPLAQEITFVVSMVIVAFLMARLLRVLEVQQRNMLIGTAIIIFVFRAIPLPGPGVTWWEIDDLGFDQQFLSILTLIAGTFTLAGMLVFRRYLAHRTIAEIVTVLTLLVALMALPNIGLYYGLHHWTAAQTGGVVDARFIAIADTAMESPIYQIAMIPMLAWIAKNAPKNLKATFFAVMASFTNLALSMSQLGTKYLNQIFSVTREVKDSATGKVTVPADYSEVGWLLISVLLIGLIVPLAVIAIVQHSRVRTIQ